MSNPVPSQAELTRRRRAQKTKQTTLSFLAATVVCFVAATLIWGYRNGWFTPRPRATPVVVDESDPAPSTAQPQTVYPVRNFVFVVNPAPATRDRAAKFLAAALASFGPKQAVDVMVLTDGGFKSVTNGCVSMTPAVRLAAQDAVTTAADAPRASIRPALLRAADEHAEAVYYLTPAQAVTEFGPDPAAGLKQMTGDHVVPINCVVFLRPVDSPADLDRFKTLAKFTHGEYVPTGK